jgi:hypothetical protein
LAEHPPEGVGDLLPELFGELQRRAAVPKGADGGLLIDRNA